MNMIILPLFSILRVIKMGQDKYYEYCVYTIKHSNDLNVSVFGTREGTFTENNRWTKAKKWLDDAHANNQDLIIIFAPAENTRYLHSWGIVTKIQVNEDKSTTYSFKELAAFVPFENGVYKHELVLKGTGKNIAPDFIRPYALCRTPYDIIEHYSVDMENLTKEEREELELFYEYRPDAKPSDESTGNEPVNLDTALKELDGRMEKVPLEKRMIEINKTFRNDSFIVKMIKERYEYRCQFPGCMAKVRTKSGKDYVEVAHITPVSEGGKSLLNNLLVLCPNHHKEFDLGNRTITKRNDDMIAFKLNGKDYEIYLKLRGK